jgi:hypothetical protein
VRFYALVDEPEFPVVRPLSLLRRPGPSGPLEYFAADGRWHSDPRPGLVSGEDLRDLAELTVEQVEALMPLWTGRPATVGASQPAREELTGMDEQPTDAAEPQIIDHPFQPGRPPQEPTECGWDAGVWLCGFSRAEHADQGTDRQGDESTPP